MWWMVLLLWGCRCGKAVCQIEMRLGLRRLRAADVAEGEGEVALGVGIL